MARQPLLIYQSSGAQAKGFIDIEPGRVLIYDDEGDLVYTFDVPPVGGAAPDPLAAAESAVVRRDFALATNGRDPGIDSLAIICATLNALTPADRNAILIYLESRYQERAK